MEGDLLILARRPGEKLVINDDITITILEFNGNQIRIGIDAPKDVKVYREEVYMRMPILTISTMIWRMLLQNQLLQKVMVFQK